MENIFIARQAILDKNSDLVGYELLYRTSEAEYIHVKDDNTVSLELILNSFLDIGLDNIVGSALAFIKVPEDFIINEPLIPMFENQTVLELINTIKPTEEVIDSVKRLRSKGYKIALDKFKYNPAYDELINLADIIKIDILNKNHSYIQEQVDYLKDFQGSLLAEFVETPEMYQFCHSLPFDYFQGFYFCKPQLVKNKRISENAFIVLKVFEQLQDPDFDFYELEQTLAHDATLIYKLLRYVNSATFTHRKEIESIKDALVLIGVESIKNWITLILMTELSEGKPNNLLIVASVRAKMSEILAVKAGINSSQMFSIGLLSLLDALIDIPMIEILDEITVSNALKMALLEYEGEQGILLQHVIWYEQGNWSKLLEGNINVGDYIAAYIEAVQWADLTVCSLSDS